MQADTKAIKERCGTAAQIARKLEVTEGAIFKLFSGESLPSYKMINRFIKAYGLTESEVNQFFFGGTAG